MATLFTRIIHGDLPGRFVWRDELCVAFLSINPLQPGHTLVVPIAEIDHWIDLPPELSRHLMEVSHHIGRAQQVEFAPEKVGLMIAGLEVPHCHIHLVPIRGPQDLDFANAELDADPAELDAAARRLRTALRAAGHDEFVAD